MAEEDDDEQAALIEKHREARPSRAADQQRYTDQLVAAAEERLQALVLIALAETADAFTSRVLAAGDPIDPMDTSAIEGMWDEHVPGLADAAADIYTVSANAAAAATGRSLPITQQLRTQHMLTATNRMSDVGRDLWNETTKTLAAGDLAGESYDQLRARLKETFAEGGKELGETRASRIARTEVQSAVNSGTLDGVRSSGGYQPKYKTWLSTLGPRTRDAHAEADGQTVPVDGMFEVGGEQLQYPGDPSASPENVIQCRCTMVFGDDPGDGIYSDNREMQAIDYCGSSLAAAGDVECAVLDDPAALRTTTAEGVDAVSSAGDTAVPDDVGGILDKWVQQRGSSTITDDETRALVRSIVVDGEKVPDSLYRGMNIEGKTQKQILSDFKSGKEIDVGAASFSRRLDSALPYAENGAGEKIVLHLNKAPNSYNVKGLNVSDRALAKAGFAEEEWILAGRFHAVRPPTIDAEGVINVWLSNVPKQ